jgi:putative ABC transport system substrate-binding protein
MTIAPKVGFGIAREKYVCTDALVNTNRISINILAVGAGLPTIHGTRDYVEAGGLISYGPNYQDCFVTQRTMATRFLRGAKPGNIHQLSSRLNSIWS